MENLSSDTLRAILQDFLEPATKLYRLSSLSSKISNEVFSDSFTREVFRVVLDEYLKFLNKKILDLDDTSPLSLLGMYTSISGVFEEIHFVYCIFFGKADFGDRIVKEFNSRSDTRNLNMMFEMIQALSRDSKHIDVVHYIMEESLDPIIQNLMSISFKNPDIAKLDTNLKIKMKKNQNYDFVVENVPTILDNCIQDVLVSAQNLMMIKKSDDEMFRALVSWKG